MSSDADQFVDLGAWVVMILAKTDGPGGVAGAVSIE